MLKFQDFVNERYAKDVALVLCRENVDLDVFRESMLGNVAGIAGRGLGNFAMDTVRTGANMARNFWNDRVNAGKQMFQQGYNDIDATVNKTPGYKFGGQGTPATPENIPPQMRVQQAQQVVSNLQQTFAALGYPPEVFQKAAAAFIGTIQQAPQSQQQQPQA